MKPMTLAQPLSATRPSAAAPRAHLFGVSAALTTPFDASGALDAAVLGVHAADVIARGADGVTLFGTTGEGASLSSSERAAALDAVLAAGVDPARVTVCVCASAAGEAIAQTQAATDRGVRRLLSTPPFYFKGVSDAALEAWFDAALDPVARAGAQAILYHIPQVTGVGLSIPLIRSLKGRFGDAVFGVKDSSGDWTNAQALLGFDDFAVLIGDERLLPQAAPLGGAGAISGMANLFPAEIGGMIRSGRDLPGLRRLVNELLKTPVTPAVKALVAAARREPGWARVRPPLAVTPLETAAGLARLMQDGA
jgi:4-hydroxy-tetrahydrodipicolinate synthase